MSIKKLSFMLLGALSLTALLGGCGSDNKEGSAGNAGLDSVPKVSEAACAQCHGSSYNPQSGMQIYSEYVQSKHFKNTLGEVIGCQDCHGGGSQHNGVGPMPYPNPDAAGKCWGCHQPAFIGAYGAPSAVEKAHFKNMTSYRIQYINPTSAEGTRCTGCHEPHNPNSGLGAAERKAWAESGHGDVAGAAWLPSSTHKWLATGDSADFSTGVPASDCVRCHTADGFKQFVGSGYKNVNSVAGDPKANSALKCSACHYNDSFSVRGAGAFTARYNKGVSPKTFPDVGNSNLCIACHSARESGDSIAAVADFTNSSFVNSHYMAAAATMYMSNSFTNYTTLTSKMPGSKDTENLFTNNYTTPAVFVATANSTTLDKTLLPLNTTAPFGIAGGQNSAHRRLGTPLIAGSETYLPAGGIALTTNGPCVTCHMQADNPVAGDSAESKDLPVPATRPAHGHSLLIDSATAFQVCLPCHGEQHLDGGDGAGNPIITATTNLATLQSAMIEPQSKCFQDGLTLAKKVLLTKWGISYSTTYPYFYDMTKDPTGKTQVKDWTRGTKNQAFGKKMMGACFNLNLLIRDPGAYLHARTFTQRLVYDVIDFFDDGNINFSTLATARATTPTIYKGWNVNVRASDGSLATESMIWLSGTHYSDPGAVAGVNTKLTPMRLRP